MRCFLFVQDVEITPERFGLVVCKQKIFHNNCLGSFKHENCHVKTVLSERMSYFLNAYWLQDHNIFSWISAKKSCLCNTYRIDEQYLLAWLVDVQLLLKSYEWTKIIVFLCYIAKIFFCFSHNRIYHSILLWVWRKLNW